jgi:hypothetical protein
MDPERHDGFGKDDPLWDLLDHASKPPPPSPYFARRVLRELDAPGASASGWGWFRRLRLARVWVPVAAAITVLAASSHFWSPQAPVNVASTEAPWTDDGQLPPNPDQRISTVLADLDDLIAFEDNQMGDDDGTWQ